MQIEWFSVAFRQKKLDQRTIHIILLSNGKHKRIQKKCVPFFKQKEKPNDQTKAWISAVQRSEVMICNFFPLVSVYACVWVCLFSDVVDYIFGNQRKSINFGKHGRNRTKQKHWTYQKNKSKRMNEWMSTGHIHYIKKLRAPKKMKQNKTKTSTMSNEPLAKNSCSCLLMQKSACTAQWIVQNGLCTIRSLLCVFVLFCSCCNYLFFSHWFDRLNVTVKVNEFVCEWTCWHFLGGFDVAVCNFCLICVWILRCLQ